MRTGLVTFIVGAVVLSACGRYMPPVSPEMRAPKAVENLVVIPSESGVAFSWTSPEQDRRGKELNNIEGYSIERKEIAQRGDETNPSVRFDDFGFVSDTHIVKREELRKEAREAGKIGRNIKAPSELTKFSFTDRTPKVGVTYIYQIVPKNNGGVEGQVGQVVKIAFQGTQSAVLLSTSKELEDIAAKQLPVQ